MEDMSFEFGEIFWPSQEDRIMALSERVEPVPPPLERDAGEECHDNREELLREYSHEVASTILSSMAPQDPSKMKDVQCRYWFFTWNMGEHICILAMKKQITDYPSRWTICAIEHGTRNRRAHLQGAFYFKSATKWSTLVKQFKGIWIVPAKGTASQIIKYCTKEDKDCFQRGEPPVDKQEASKRGGAATAEKYQDALEIAKDPSKSLLECDASLVIKHLPNLCKIRATFGPVPDDLEKPMSFWLFGRPGTGKSTYVRNFCRDNDLLMFSKPLEDQWWDEMPSRTCVTLLDDFDIEHKNYGRSLKIWADQYKFVVNIKNVKSSVRPSHFFVTSNYHPNEIWSGKMLEALARRFTVKFFYRDDEQLEDLSEEWNVDEKIKVDFELN